MTLDTTTFETPVLFLIFNRPDTTRQVFAEIRKRKPKTLFIAADGPRASVAADAVNCAATRAVVKNIDWDCKVEHFYRDKNLGCKVGVTSAIDWFFRHVDEGIILEDDCLPDPSFFTFCRDLLEQYRDDPRIIMVGGNNFQKGIKRGDGSYYFSIYDYVWGWATWKRAWSLYDLSMTGLPDFLESGRLKKLLPNAEDRGRWLNRFKAVLEGEIDTWDYQWAYKIWSTGGMCIAPNANLVTNLGFGDSATHSKDAGSSKAHLPLESITTIIHPSRIAVDTEADEFFERQSRTAFWKKVVVKTKMLMRNMTNRRS